MKKTILAIGLLIGINSYAQFKGSAQIGGSANFGNYSMINLVESADFSRVTDKSSFSLLPSYRWTKKSAYGSNRLTQYENEPYVSASLTRKEEEYRIMIFSETEASFLRKEKLRFALGAGIGKTLKFSNGTISLSEIILPEKYWSNLGKTWDNISVRASTRIKVLVKIKNLDFSTVNLIQPPIWSQKTNRLGDNLNIRSTNTVTLNPMNKISICFTYNLIYQGYPNYINLSVRTSENDFTMGVKMAF